MQIDDPYTRAIQERTINKYLERNKLAIGITKQPHHIAILAAKENYFVVCGGSIINQKWILTGGLCKGRNISVLVGTDDMYSGAQHAVERVWHKFSINSSLNRIILLELRENLTLGDSVKPILLGEDRDIVEGRNATFTCYNLLLKDNNSEYIHGLIKGRFRVTKCLGVFRKPSWEFCGVSDTKMDIDCEESIGGGLVIDGKLIGVGTRLPGCYKPGSQGIFASVPPFKDWINEVIEGKILKVPMNFTN